ncbi:MAG: oligosaccharide flippase family protein [Ancalomicrobiaceae bacterium]|nr:oligosaccharide flippase family protein [Ancalomicrobiaceae bacterium]
MQRQLIGWLGWAGLDTFGRLALLTGSTAILSRLLTPHDFGLTALVLIIVTVASVFVGTPFEEALAQMRVLRRRHVQAALAAAWAMGALLLALSIPAAYALAHFYAEPEITVLLPVTLASVFFSGYSDVMTGLARRLNRFNDVAKATLIGHVVGVSLSVGLALLGFGLWALIAQRVLVVIVRALALQWLIGFVIVPVWSNAQLRAMRRYAGLSLVDRLADNLTFLAFNSVVSALYGVTVLGYVNMAMRVVEPIRGAVGATAHNFAFSFFAAVHNDAQRLKQRADLVMARTSYVIAPMFVGLAAVTPILLPLVSGPGWDQAIDIAVCLGIGTALALPPRLVFTALSAKARPEFSLIGNLLGVAGTLVVLIALQSYGPISVGISRVVGDALQAVYAFALIPPGLDWSRTERLASVLPSWAISAAMAVAVVGLEVLMPEWHGLLALGLAIALGIATYMLGFGLFAREHFRGLILAVRPARRGEAAARR